MTSLLRPARRAAWAALALTAALFVRAQDPELQPRFYRFLDWTVPHTVEEAFVQYVYDGDTLQDRYQRRVRLLGVNAPEVAHPEHDKFENEPGGIEAMNYTEKTVRGKKVFLVVDRDNTQDRFGRTLAVVFVQNDLGRWMCLNWELVRQGLGETLILPDNRLCLESEWYRMGVTARRRRAEDFDRLAQAYAQEGRPESAVEAYQEGIRLFPDARDLYENLGNLYLDMRLPGFSVDIYLAYLERHPDDEAVRYRLARAYETMAAEAGALALVNYRKKAAGEWRLLADTKYDAEAREALARLR